MRRVILVALLVAGLASPGFAAASAALPITTSPPSLGGVVGTGGSTVMSSSVVIKLGSVTFANLTCSGSTCTGTVAGVSGTFTVSTVNGMTVITSSSFPTHGAWVSTVANWASDHRTALAAAGFTVGNIVSGAARIEGPLASANRIPNQSGQGEGHGSHGRR
jgi:hypothetical protein